MLIDNLGNPIQGWSFGVIHDPAFATLEGVVDGQATLTVNNGTTPDFNQTYYTSSGFAIAVVISLISAAALNNGTDLELNVATYELNGSNGATTSSLDYCDCIVTPGGVTANTVVVVGGATIVPAMGSGTLTILPDCSASPPPPMAFTCEVDTTNNCQCQALLQWQVPASPFGTFEVFVDGLLVATLANSATSAIVPLPASDSVPICIRTQCGDLYSTLVCCTVACNLPNDCNNNGIPDDCDIDQGILDCNNNGQIDECEISSGAETDCNQNGMIDACETTAIDCNNNGVLDVCEISSGAVSDCNFNGIIDDCEYDPAFDCNGNGIIDSCDLASGSSDTNNNGIPDECESTPFIRSEANGDGLSNIADGISLLTYLFLNGDLDCLDAGDVNDDGALNIADTVSLLTFLFNSGAAPPAPFPDCGIDPTMDTLGCDSFPACP